MSKFSMSFAFHFYILGLTPWIWTSPSTEALKFESPSNWNSYEDFNFDHCTYPIKILDGDLFRVARALEDNSNVHTYSQIGISYYQTCLHRRERERDLFCKLYMCIIRTCIVSRFSEWWRKRFHIHLLQIITRNNLISVSQKISIERISKGHTIFLIKVESMWVEDPKSSLKS